MYNMCLYFAIIIVKHSQKFLSVFGAHIKKVTFTVLHQRDLGFLFIKEEDFIMLLYAWEGSRTRA
jgi:hypothetical protein